MVKTVIYKIINPKGKVYIGKTFDIIRRKSHYKNLFCKKQPKIYNSLKKYGWEAHKLEIIEECSKELLIEREIFHKQQFINEFGWNKALFCNILDEGGGPLSEETRKKISKSKKGHVCFNDEWKEKIKKSLNKNNHSKYYTDEVKAKISKAMVGRKVKFTEEHKNNIQKAQLKKSKRVLQLDLEGNFIKEWESKGLAAKWIKEQTGKNSNICSQIKDCCLGYQKTAHGFKWKYKE